MNWTKEGERAARIGPGRWQEIGEGHYRQACAVRDNKVEELRYRGALLQDQERALVADLNAGPARPAHVLRLSLAEGLFWFAVALAFFWAGYELALMTLPILSKFGEGRQILALSFGLGTAVAFEWFLRRIQESFPENARKTWMLFLALVPVLCLLAGALAMSLLRGEYVATQGALTMLETQGVEIEGVAGSVGGDKGAAVIEGFYKRTGQLSNLLMFLAAVGLEFTAALAFHEALARIPSAWFTLRAQGRLRRTRSRMAECATAIGECQRYPEIAQEEFTRAALLEEARLRERQARPGYRLPEGFGLTLGLLIAVMLFVLFFGFLVRDAFGEEAVVVAIDQSSSTAGEEYAQNLRAVERVIAGLKPGSRFVVIGISEQSFAAPVILDARLAADQGLFGERVRNGQRKLLRVWQERAKTLKPDGKQTDVFGALAKAAVLFADSPHLNPVLVLLTDMRHVGRGYNFERAAKIDQGLLPSLEQAGLVPALKGVEVWVLGAHVRGVTEVYWMSLRTFWQEYLKRAGAKLMSFSPDRRYRRE